MALGRQLVGEPAALAAGYAAYAAANAAGSPTQSYAYCDRLARREAVNFYHAFRLLPADQRRAMCALYAFMRVADDLADGPGDVESRRRSLEDWRRQFDAALAGEYRHPLHPALAHTVARSGVHREALAR